MSRKTRKKMLRRDVAHARRQIKPEHVALAQQHLGDGLEIKAVIRKLSETLGRAVAVAAVKAAMS
ncbi:MAG: hypothetical protein ABII13_04965 [Patescibacteria group bacterium]